MAPNQSRLRLLSGVMAVALAACAAPTTSAVATAQSEPVAAEPVAAQAPATSAVAPAGAQAIAELSRADGAPAGTTRIVQSAEGLDVAVALIGMAPGTYAVHIHTTGRCDAPDFASAGGHWNPSAKQHGRDNPMGAHSGDLPNAVIGADGTGTIAARVPGALTGDMGLLDADGAAVMVHAGPDDFRTDPSGNSGARIACGILRTTG